MFRLFLIVYVLIVTTIVAAVVSINLFSRFLMERVEKDSYDVMYSAPFLILNDSVAGLKEDALELRLSELRADFKYPIELVPGSSIDISQRDRLRLEAGGVIGKNIQGAHTLFSNSAIEGQLWSYVVALNEYESEVALATGPMNLLKRKIESLNVQQRLSVLDDFTEETDYLFDMGQAGHFDLRSDELDKLDKNRVIVRNPGKADEQFFIKLDEDGVILQATVAGYPWYGTYLTSLIFACAFLSLALFSMFWLWPLWRDLRSLRQAATDIAAGRLEARVNAKRPSMIKSVLLGFNAMADSNQNMISSQKDLTDAVSHELRTPLARMKFGLEMLGDATEAEERKRHTEDIKLDVNELNNLVDELLSFAREDNHVSTEKIDVLSAQQMAAWLQEQLQHACRGHTGIEISLEFDTPGDVTLYSKSMARAVSNGLQNALRYATAKIILRFEVIDRHFVLSIEDDGPGIPDALRTDIFEPFKSTDGSRNREYGGYGLGLAIVKRIAEAHGGIALIKDTKLGGNRLIIQWPIEASAKSTR